MNRYQHVFVSHLDLKKFNLLMRYLELEPIHAVSDKLVVDFDNQHNGIINNHMTSLLEYNTATKEFGTISDDVISYGADNLLSDLKQLCYEIND